MKYFFTLLLSFVCGIAIAQQDIPATNELKITGDVKQERSFTVQDITKFKAVDLGDVPVKNHKGEVKYVSKGVKGVLVKSILDSVALNAEKPKELSQYIFIFTSSDNYKNVYSWNELFNSETGNHLYLIVAKDGKDITNMEERIQVFSLGDINAGMRRMRGLASIEVRKIK